MPDLHPLQSLLPFSTPDFLQVEEFTSLHCFLAADILFHHFLAWGIVENLYIEAKWSDTTITLSTI